MTVKKTKKLAIQFRFFIIFMVELVVITGLAYALGWLLETWRGIRVELPLFLWGVLLSVVLGTVTSAYMMRSFFSPISKLRNAMNEVASGNFKVEVKNRSKIPEIAELYAGFNTMVKELRSTETLQTDFISDVSHEFKTPISAIEGYTALLQNSTLTEEERQLYIGKILSNTHRVSNLVGNILLLSKAENQSVKSARSRFRADEQIRQALLMLEPKWAPKNLEFDVELDEILYDGYETLTFHIWSNLLDNAVKFSPEGGLITMRLTETEEGICFTVSDRGPGIPAGEEQRIFGKFYQSDSSHKTEGNGLGLALVRQIAEAHGGTAEAANLPDGGACFRIVLR